MTKLQTYQVGLPRKRGQGLRIGVMRYWPRGVKKKEAARLYFDVWLPLLAPSRQLIQWYRANPTDERWQEFSKRYQREMQNSANSRQAIQLLARLAKQTPISVGCSCKDEKRCHRSILRKLIEQAAKG
jgi:uncharacterized protein YeaO (DUF488 family)